MPDIRVRPLPTRERIVAFLMALAFRFDGGASVVTVQSDGNGFQPPGLPAVDRFHQDAIESVENQGQAGIEHILVEDVLHQKWPERAKFAPKKKRPFLPPC